MGLDRPDTNDGEPLQYEIPLLDPDVRFPSGRAAHEDSDQCRQKPIYGWYASELCLEGRSISELVFLIDELVKTDGDAA
jgi:hypothetical protein